MCALLQVSLHAMHSEVIVDVYLVTSGRTSGVLVDVMNVVRSDASRVDTVVDEPIQDATSEAEASEAAMDSTMTDRPNELLEGYVKQFYKSEESCQMMRGYISQTPLYPLVVIVGCKAVVKSLNHGN